MFGEHCKLYIHQAFVYYAFHSDTCGECCGAAVYDRIRDGDRSTLDYYMHYRSVPLMMSESAYGGFDWHGDFLQEDSETRMVWQLASAFDDAGLSLTAIYQKPLRLC